MTTNPTNWRAEFDKKFLIKVEGYVGGTREFLTSNPGAIKVFIADLLKAQRAADYAAVEKVLLEQLDGARLVLNLIRPIYEQKEGK